MMLSRTPMAHQIMLDIERHTDELNRMNERLAAWTERYRLMLTTDSSGQVLPPAPDSQLTCGFEMKDLLIAVN